MSKKQWKSYDREEVEAIFGHNVSKERLYVQRCKLDWTYGEEKRSKCPKNNEKVKKKTHTNL